MPRGEDRHHRALSRIAACPSKFGIENVVSSDVEKNLFYEGRILVQPDVIFELNDGKGGKISGVYIVEFKATGNGEAYERARTQLEKAQWWFGRHRSDLGPEDIKTKIIPGDDPQYKEFFR